MPKIAHGVIWRGDTRIGYWDGGDHVQDENENRIGWWQDGYVYRQDSTDAIGYVKDDYIYWSDGQVFGRLDWNFEHVANGDSYYPPMLCAAITLLFGKDEGQEMY